MVKKDHFLVGPAAWTYLIGALLLLFVGAWVQHRDFYSGMIITEYLLVFIPVIAVALIFKISLKKGLRVNSLKWSECILIPFTVIVSIPITLLLNLVVISIMAATGKAYDTPIPVAGDLKQFVILFFIISISAGICEEVFFRGMVLDAYASKYGKKIGVVISALMFGVFHFNPQNFLGPIFLGILFGVLVLVTDSLLAGILAHMTNNGVVVFLSYVAKVSNGAASNGASLEMYNNNPGMLFIALGVLAFFAVGSGIGVFGLIKVIQYGRRKNNVASSVEPKEALIGPADEMSDIELKVRKIPSWVNHIPLVLVAIIYSVLVFLFLN